MRVVWHCQWSLHCIEWTMPGEAFTRRFQQNPRNEFWIFCCHAPASFLSWFHRTGHCRTLALVAALFFCAFNYWKTRKQVAFCHIHKSQSWKVRTSMDKPWLNRAFQSFDCNSIYSCLRAIDYAPTGKSAVCQSDCKACQLFYRLFPHLRMSKKFRPSCALHSLAEDLEFCLRAMSVSRPCDSVPFSLEK